MGSVTRALRPMSVADLEQVVALESDAQPSPWSEQIFRDEMNAPGRTYLVVEESGIAGFGGVLVVDGDAHITNLLVAPTLRGSGLGTILVKGLVQAALKMGAVNLTLEVRARNEIARRLYSKFGLAPVGVRRGYYGDDDALIMWVYGIDGDEYASRIERMQ